MARARTIERKVGVTEEGFQFSKIVGTTGSERFVLRASKEMPKFVQETSMMLLNEAGLIAVEQDLEIPVLVADRKLQRTLTDNGEHIWFYTLGQGPLNLPQFQHVKNGTLVSGKGGVDKETGIRETTVRNCDGPYPLSLDVYQDEYARCDGRRFVRNADDWPSLVAPVVYGKLAEPQAQAGREAAAQKVDPALVSSFRAVVSKLDAATQAGVLESGIVNISKEVLRRIE